MMRAMTILAGGILLGACAEGGTLEPESEAGAEAAARTKLPAPGARSVTVMTRNLYLGASFDILADPRQTDPIPVKVARIWGQVVASNFPERVEALAAEIAAVQPHLVGLQEVVLYRVQPDGDAAFGGRTPATAVAFDFLQLLLEALEARGLTYYAVATQQLSDLEFPAFVSPTPPHFMDIRYTDRDVILARADVPVSEAGGATYAAKMPFPVNDMIIPVLRGWTSVRATVAGNTFRFVNTHLETQSGARIQEAQAAELLAALQGEAGPVVLVGDFNSAANVRQTASYEMIVGAGYVDVWTDISSAQPGYTCCHPNDLRGVRPLDQRIDLVFVRGELGIDAAGIVGGVHMDVVGEEVQDRTASGLWPSDHAGVAAILRMPPAVASLP